MDKQNEKINELTKKQMEKVSGGYNEGTDCFLCPGVYINDETRKCSCSLTLSPSGAYRCNNSLCTLFLKDQYPAVRKLH